jgi:hypothetical protein
VYCYSTQQRFIPVNFDGTLVNTIIKVRDLCDAIKKAGSCQCAMAGFCEHGDES